MSEYPITYNVSDVIRIIKDAPHSYQVETARFGTSKKDGKTKVVWDRRYCSKLRHAIEMALDASFDRDLTKILDKMDQVEKLARSLK